jgi:hypothetical protein|nr:MAG TPA: hypothetical protein [Bacteriophage sp.]
MLSHDAMTISPPFQNSRRGVYLFHSREFHPHLCLCRTSYGFSIQDFHFYFITYWYSKAPLLGIVDEPLPSSHVPYDLRGTLGYLDARAAIPNL